MSRQPRDRVGDFQLTMHWSNGSITPYNLYDG
jgi:hypothetical protein